MTKVLGTFTLQRGQQHQVPTRPSLKTHIKWQTIELSCRTMRKAKEMLYIKLVLIQRKFPGKLIDRAKPL